jgi:hypothetical protein
VGPGLLSLCRRAEQAVGPGQPALSGVTGRLASNFVGPARVLEGLVVAALLAALAFVRVDVVRHLFGRGLLGKLV